MNPIDIRQYRRSHKRNYGIGSKADYNPNDYRFLREQSIGMKDAELIPTPSVSSPLRYYIIAAASLTVLCGFLYGPSLWAWMMGL